jgi:FSR family fosmidomycin resistance protein-like MFS transporter
MNRRQITLLTLAHMFTDINQGALPALLPLLIPRHGLSYAAAAAVVFSSNIASTVVQPAFGHLADRVSWPWLPSAALAMACLGLGLTGLAPAYPLLLLSAVTCGVGVAAFHPVAAQLVNRHAGDGTAGALSLWGGGGTMGFTLGPIFAALATGWWGLDGTAALAGPGCLMAVLTAWAFTRVPKGGPAQVKAKAGAETGKTAWGAFARLSGTIVCRSMLFFGLNTFIPLYWINVLGQSEGAGATALTVFAGSTVVGSLAGRRLADRHSKSRIIFLSYLAIIPLIPGFLFMTTPGAALAMLVPLGLGMSVPYSAMIVLGQSYLPGRIGLSSGVTLGLAISIGGIAAPILGMIADAHGLHTALATTMILPVASAAMAWTLPDPEAAPARLTSFS